MSGLEDLVELKRAVSVEKIPLILSKDLSKSSVKVSLVSHQDESHDIQSIAWTLPSGALSLYQTSFFKPYSCITDVDYVWSIKDGSVFTSVAPGLDKKLKQAYGRQDRSSDGVNSFLFNGEVFNVNYETKILSGRNGSIGPIRKSPPFWSYKVPDVGFIRHEDKDSSAIEGLFRFGGRNSNMGGTCYTFQFSPNQSFQVDVSTQEMVEITRYPPITANPREIELVLSVRGPKVEVEQFLLSLQYNHSRELVFDVTADVKLQHLVVHQIANVCRSFCVSATHELKNNKIKTVIYGEESYVGRVCEVLNGLIAELQRLCLAPRAEVPAGWESQVSECELKLVPQTSPEWVRVLQQIKLSLPRAQIIKLERVQNLPLWQKYKLEKEQMRRRNNEEVNEKYLFHGTKNKPPQEVVLSEKGIDFRFSRSDGNLWGTGAYFAETASYSDLYSHKVYLKEQNCKQLIVAQVLTGRSYCYENGRDRTLTKPPPLPLSLDARGIQLYDTVNGNINNTRIYVVYDHDKSYPAYVVSYRGL